VGRQLDPPGLEAWEPWHPNEVFSLLDPVEAPWHFAGGWAVDLWLGFQTRSHEDIEIAILRDDFNAFRRALDGVHFFCAGSGQLQYLPTVALPPESIHQVWCLEAQTRRWKLDIMLEPGTAEEWIFRRDSSIRRRRTDVIGRTDEGMPYLKPAGVLLFKTKHLRGKDELDFENALGKLEAEERDWLRTALNHAHPGHEWIARLSESHSAKIAYHGMIKAKSYHTID
jgi:Aminoglycoside-2''-adenylyltransferase